MFLEPQFTNHRSGSIEIICGSMFSGKTEELIRRLKRALIANLEVEIFKPAIDTRYDDKKIVSHDANFIKSTPVKKSMDILTACEGRNIKVVGIDEAQFFDLDLIQVAETLSLQGIRVIVAGLDMDFKGRPFGPMPYLLSVAEYVTKVHAICQRCGNLATHSYRLVSDDSKVLLGEKKEYEPRCRTCYNDGKTDS
jgi:thymidine kinase